MNSTTVPILRYRDADKAIHWLCKAFGFDVFLKVPGEDGRIEHARLTLETNMIMLASIGRPGEAEAHFVLPRDAGGVTQSTYLSVMNPERVYKAAVAAGARITIDIHDSEFGGRLFSCEDVEGHVWVFSNGDLWKKTW
jgi:uncharacterized glyoxalase superfamily protein PhnB